LKLQLKATNNRGNRGGVVMCNHSLRTKKKIQERRKRSKEGRNEGKEKKKEKKGEMMERTEF
jgi:sRNA-binding protein